jgi:hypothetical protein
MGTHSIRPYQPGDEDAILALHNRAFPDHPARRLRQWTWKFRDNPLGRTEIMVAMDGSGRCAGVYAGVTLRIVLDGQPVLAGNHIDVAVDPDLRRGMAGARILVELGRRYFDAYAGGDTLLTWGFPEPALHRLGLRLLRFEVLRDVVFLVRAPDGDLEIPQEIEVRTVPRFEQGIDALWTQCRDEVRIGLIRDAGYLNWRYAEQPDIRHLLLEARDRRTGTVRGAAVLREGGWDESILSLLDWLVPLDDRAAEAALVRHALQEAARRGKRFLVGWFPLPRMQFNRFQADHGFFVQATPYQECFRAFRRGLDRRRLDRDWYQTMGDIDFF